MKTAQYVNYPKLTTFARCKDAMIGKNIVYSLKTRKGIPTICYDLTNGITFENNSEITIELPGETVTLKKSEYLNYPSTLNFKVYDNKDIFFLLCNKHVSAKYAFEVLLKYASEKLGKKIAAYQTLKNECDNILNKKLTAA